MMARIAILLTVACVAFTAPALAQSGDPREEAGVWIGVTLGNLVFVPLKAVSAASGAVTGALSLVLMGGDEEVSRQIWQDTLGGPYVITPDLARGAIGARPEVEPK